MTREEIKSAAIDIISSIQANFGAGFQGRGFFEHYTRHGVQLLPNDLRRPFEQYLEGKLPSDEEAFFCTGTSGGNLSVFHLAESMLERLIREDDIDEIIDDVLDLLESGRSDTTVVRSIVGISIDQPIEIERDVWLVRPAEVPPNINRERMFKIDRWGDLKINHDGFDIQLPPHAALLFNSANAKVIGRQDEFFDGRPENSNHQRISRITNDVCAAACLSCNSSPFPSWTYSMARHPAVGYGNFGNSGASGSFHPPMLSYGKIDPEKFIRFYNLLRDMKSGYKNVILALDRLALSRARHIFVDKAIDLGIALEVTLLNQLKEGELSYRLKTRGAWLLANNFAERDRISKLLGKIYTLRSQAAHNGEFDDKFSKDAAFISILKEGEIICGQVIERIVERGGFPDWDGLTLGQETA